MVSQPETSPTWLLPFRNILQLEEDHGFDNGAVWGGLDKFLQRWSPEMASHLKEPGSAEQLFHPDYASMSTEERREWTSAWRILLTLDTEDKGLEASSGASPAAREQAASVPSPSAKSAGPHQSSPGQTPEAPPEGLTVDAPIDR